MFYIHYIYYPYYIHYILHIVHKIHTRWTLCDTGVLRRRHSFDSAPAKPVLSPTGT